MFGFKKKEQKPLWIMGKDVMDIIRLDYDCLLYTSDAADDTCCV